MTDAPLFQLRAWPTDRKVGAPAVVSKIHAYAGHRFLGQPSQFNVQAFVTDPDILSTGYYGGLGSYAEMWVGRTAPRQWWSGYLNNKNTTPKGDYIYALDFDDPWVALSEYRAADGQEMNWPQYCRPGHGILDVYNGLWNHRTRRRGMDPGHYGVLPPGSTAHWVDRWGRAPYIGPNGKREVIPGVGTSWEVRLDTAANSIAGLQAHFNYLTRLRADSTAYQLNLEIGGLGDRCPVVFWGGDALRDHLNAGHTRSTAALAGLAQRMGLCAIDTPTYTLTSDNLWNIIQVSGTGTAGDGVSLAHYWGGAPDDVGTPVQFGTDSQGGSVGRLYYLGPTHGTWRHETFRLVAWQRQDGTWEYGVMDETSVRGDRPRENRLGYGNKKIKWPEGLLEAGCGQASWDSMQIPQWTIVTRFPHTDANGAPPMVLPGMRADIRYRGEAWPVDDNGVPQAPATFLDWQNQPEMGDDRLAQWLQTIVQVDEQFDIGNGYSASLTLGKQKRGRSKGLHWLQSVARQIEHEATAGHRAAEFTDRGNLDGVSWIFTQNPNAWVYNDPAGYRSPDGQPVHQAGIISPGASMVSNFGHDNPFGDHTAVEFVTRVAGNHQALEFQFLRPKWYAFPNPLDVHGNRNDPAKGYWPSYAFLRLAMFQSGLRSGFFTTADSVTWTRKHLLRDVFVWRAGNYHVRLSVRGREFRCRVTALDQKDGHTGSHPYVEGHWYDEAGTAGYTDNSGIGFHLRGGTVPAQVWAIHLHKPHGAKGA